MKMYIYNHCPFCIRAKIVAQMTGLNYDTIVLANDDIQAHISRINAKQVPFLELDNGSYIKESLDICKYIVKKQNIIINDTTNITLVNLVNDLHTEAKKLTYPRIVHHDNNIDDFPTESAKKYFINKKSQYIGDFDELLSNPPIETINKTQTILNSIDDMIKSPFINGDEFSWDDVILFPLLMNMTIIKDLITIPNNIKNYLEYFSNKTQIKLY